MHKENKTFQCGKSKTTDMKVRVTRAEERDLSEFHQSFLLAPSQCETASASLIRKLLLSDASSLQKTQFQSNWEEYKRE